MYHFANSGGGGDEGAKEISTLLSPPLYMLKLNWVWVGSGRQINWEVLKGGRGRPDLVFI